MSNSLATGVAYLDPEFSTVYATQEIGYSTDAQGTVTQLTSKSTPVTLNKSAGRITMHNAALAGNTAVTFTLTNSVISAKDVMILNVSSGASIASYNSWVDVIASNQATITLRNATTSSLAEAVVLNYSIIHGQ
jgi:hypothetical protein